MLFVYIYNVCVFFQYGNHFEKKFSTFFDSQENDAIFDGNLEDKISLSLIVMQAISALFI